MLKTSISIKILNCLKCERDFYLFIMNECVNLPHDFNAFTIRTYY